MSDTTAEQQPSVDVDLYQELDALLDNFCSETQQKFCIEQRVVSPTELLRVRQIIEENRHRLLSPETEGPNTSGHVLQSLIRVCAEMLDNYQAVCHRRRIRQQPEGVSQTLTIEWQQLSQMFETKAEEQAELASLFDNLKGLQKAWKRIQTIERLTTSILISFEFRAGAYMVTVDRYNYGQLGLGRKAVGTRQLVFECSRINRADQMEVVAGICDRFASVFAQNAQQNLAQIEAQVNQAQPSGLARKLRMLQDKVFAANTTQQDWPDSPSQQQQQQRQIIRSNHAIEEGGDDDNISSLHGGDIGRSSFRPEPPRPTVFRSSVTTMEPSLWYKDSGLQSMPMPSFVPSPWEWPDLLKERHPYIPVFFGLLKKHRRRPSVPLFLRLRNAFVPPSPPAERQQEEEAAAPTSPTFATVSIPSLCRHFCRTGRQFYQDVMTSAQLRQSQDGHLLQEIGRDLVDTYAAIQLEASRAAMHRILAILHDLSIHSTGDDDDHHHQPPSSSSSPPLQAS